MYELIDTFSSWLTELFIPTQYVWASILIEDNRTMLIGRGKTQEAAIADMYSEESRDTLVDPTGLLKVIMPPRVKGKDGVPDGIMNAACEHLGIPNPIKNSSSED